MKAYKFILSLGACLCLTTGCYDLDVYPEDQLSSGTFFKTQDHADQAMMGVYSIMTDNDVFGRQFAFDCLGGIGAGYDYYAYQSIARGTYTTSEGQVSNKFQKLYEGISRANIVLQNVDNCDMTDELKAQYKGEAKFMRALFYFTLLDFWGAVPIYDESTVVAEDFMNMLKARSSADEVRAFIIKDLDDAIASLPKEWDSTNKGRATCGSAMALKGKVYLWNKQYTEAKDCFETLLTDKNKYADYELYPDYAGLFKPNEGDESSEMIFAIQNIGGVGQDFGMPTTFYMGTRSSYGSCWNNMMAATTFADSYETIDGSNYDYSNFQFNWDSFLGLNYSTDENVRKQVFYSKLNESKTAVATYTPYRNQLVDMYEKQRDPRMSISLICPYTTYEGWTQNAPKHTEYVLTGNTNETTVLNGFVQVNQGHECYLWRKFVATEDLGGLINNREDTPINFPLIRLADVYLMLAECYNQMENGDQEKAIKYINKVRARVNMPLINASGSPYQVTADKNTVFNCIKHERAIELAGEGHSFSDMKRWKLLETVGRQEKYITNVGKAFYTRVVRERDYLWPIPQTEIDINPNLTQNPGW